MYEHLGLQDISFIMLYGGAAMLAVVGCCYLLLTPGNAFSSDIRPPKVLRGWAAAFMAFVALSHVWWCVLGIFWLHEDRLVRNAVAIMLDSVTLMPCMMAVLLRMLQALLNLQFVHAIDFLFKSQQRLSVAFGHIRCECFKKLLQPHEIIFRTCQCDGLAETAFCKAYGTEILKMCGGET